MVSNDFPFDHPLSISLRQAVSLMGALVILKTLHVITFVSNVVLRAPPGLIRRAVYRTERYIVGIFVSVIQQSISDNNNTIHRPPIPPSTESHHSNTTSTVVPYSESLSRSTTVDENGPPTDHQAAVTPGQERGGGTVMTNVKTRLHLQDSTTVPDNSNSESTYSTAIGKAFSFSRIESRSSNAPAASSALRYTQLVPARPLFSSLSRESSIHSTDRRITSLSNTLSQEDTAVLEIDELQRSKSVASYPGKFPVSDTLDYSSLATAPASLRGHGTFARPFSDP